MATYVLIHGAASDSWYWHRVIPDLEARGHDVVAPDLPSDDDAATFPDYADVVVEAVGDRSDLIVVAQSLGGFTAALVCERIPVSLLVLVAAMVPVPGESPADWWENTGFERAHRELAERDGRATDGELDEVAVFLHDLSPDLLAEALARGSRGQSDAPMEGPWPFQGWPDVPTRFLLCRDDRFFPADFMRRVVRERLGITPDEMDGSHLPALGRPGELVERFERYRTELVAGSH
ncbi:MAG TPA: alpha/beta hydrolase [Acidimicrobiia bacterium]